MDGIDELTVQPSRTRTGRAPTAWRPVAVLAALSALVHLAVAGRYGWHRDEFYYVICGRHLAWGYVDQPPLTPALARLAAALPGGVWPLRVFAVAAQTGCIVLAGMLAAEFGGRRRAQTLAAAAVAACPIFVGGSLLFGTTVTDQLAWVALFVLVARALRLGTTRAWLAAGVVAGVALENKDTVAVLLAGIAVGLAMYRRDVLRTPAPWLAGGVAVLLAVPNLVWDATHSWSNFQMAKVLSGKQGGPLGSLAQLPLLALLLAGPFLVALWVMGARWLASPEGREHRWVLIVAVVAVALCTAGGGKPYYAAPALAGLFAAGAVRVESRAAAAAPATGAATTNRGRFRWPIAIGVTWLSTLVLALPVLPPRGATAVSGVSAELMETYGWPLLADQVAQAARPLPAGTPIFTSNYGEAGALIILGPSAGLHNPVYSGHNNYGLWGPPPGGDATVLCVGQFDATYLRRFWTQVTEIAPFTLPSGLKNHETKQGAAIYLCQDPRGTWTQLWPSLRHLD